MSVNLLGRNYYENLQIFFVKCMSFIFIRDWLQVMCFVFDQVFWCYDYFVVCYMGVDIYKYFLDIMLEFLQQEEMVIILFLLYFNMGEDVCEFY